MIANPILQVLDMTNMVDETNITNYEQFLQNAAYGDACVIDEATGNTMKVEDIFTTSKKFSIYKKWANRKNEPVVLKHAGPLPISEKEMFFMTFNENQAQQNQKTEVIMPTTIPAAGTELTIRVELRNPSLQLIMYSNPAIVTYSIEVSPIDTQADLVRKFVNEVNNVHHQGTVTGNPQDRMVVATANVAGDGVILEFLSVPEYRFGSINFEYVNPRVTVALVDFDNGDGMGLQRVPQVGNSVDAIPAIGYGYDLHQDEFFAMGYYQETPYKKSCITGTENGFNYQVDREEYYNMVVLEYQQKSNGPGRQEDHPQRTVLLFKEDGTNTNYNSLKANINNVFGTTNEKTFNF